jgi:hypothetical protein
MDPIHFDLVVDVRKVMKHNRNEEVLLKHIQTIHTVIRKKSNEMERKERTEERIRPYDEDVRSEEVKRNKVNRSHDRISAMIFASTRIVAFRTRLSHTIHQTIPVVT